MRASLLLLLSLGSAPAAAQPVAPPAPPEPNAIQIPPELTDPRTANRLADAMQSLSSALLDVKIGGLQATLEGREPTRAERNTTVRDLARRDDPQIDRHIQQRIAEAKPRIEQSMKALNDALPSIMQGLEQAQKSLERAVANMPDPNYPKR
jgi:hypothetical protein